jgi:hypothetical protein
VAAFGEGPAEWLCDGQFAVLPQQVLCFFTLDSHADGHDGRADGIRVESPTRVFWRPSRPDYAAGDECPWLPTVVREVFSGHPHYELLREHQMFLRRPGDERYVYAGRAHLGGRSGGNVDPWADFSLRAKLPRDRWVRFGGFPGWLVGVGARSERVAAGDTAAYARLAAELGPGEGRIFLTRYEQDSLSASVNAERGHVGYTGPDGQGHWAARDPAPGGDADEVVWLPGCCDSWDVPRSETLPRAAAIEAAAEFFRTGRPPACVGWSEGLGHAEPGAAADGGGMSAFPGS